MANQLTKQDLIEILEARFLQERVYYQSQRDEDRVYFRQLLMGELAEIREQLERIEQQIGGDASAALIEIDEVKERLTKLETTVAKLQVA